MRSASAFEPRVRPRLRCRLPLAAVACLVLAGSARTAVAQDVVIARDGTRSTGRLASCVGGVCMLGGKEIARAGIAWIGFGQEGAPSREAAGGIEPGARDSPDADRLLLADGSTVAARVVGISLGVVATDAGSYDRSLVAWVRFAGAPEAEPGDLLLLRSGASSTGELAGCTEAACTFEGRAYGRDEISWLGLGTGEASPPLAQDPGEDEVHLAEGDVVPGRVHRVGADEVVAARGHWPRDRVAWIRLTPLLEDGEAPPGQIGAPEDDVEPAGEGEETVDDDGGDDADGLRHDDPPFEPPPTDPRAPGPPPGNGEGELGTLWTGTLTGHMYGVADGIRSDWTVSVEVRLRERRFPWICVLDGRAQRIGTFVELEPERSVITNQYACSGQDLVCSGSGSVTVSAGRGIEGIGHASSMWLKDVDRDISSCLGVDLDVPRGGGIYVIGISARHDDEFTVRMDVPGGSSTTEHGYASPVIGGGILPDSPPCGDRALRTLEGGGTIMRGSFSGACVGCCPQIAASWSVCREGVACPPPPEPETGAAPPPAEEDPCDRIGNLPSQRDLCRNQLDLLTARLEPHVQAHADLIARANENIDAFASADLQCEIWDQTEKLLKTLITGGMGRAGEAGRALLYLADVLEKAQGGDLASLFYPEELQKFLEAKGLVDDLYAELEADEVTLMQKRLQECVGKVGNETLRKAEAMVADLVAAKAIWESEVAPGLNDLRSKGYECADWNHQVWRACLEEAECRGTPPADCGPEPDLGPESELGATINQQP
jgi:hypothetical protein